MKSGVKSKETRPGLAQSWKVLEFSLTLIIVAWKELFDAFWLSKAEYKSKLREFKGYLHKVLYVLCNK